MRHLSIKELWLQEEVREGRIKVMKVESSENEADLMTKHLAPKEFQKQKLRIGVGPSARQKEVRYVAMLMTRDDALMSSMTSMLSPVSTGFLSRTLSPSWMNAAMQAASTLAKVGARQFTTSAIDKVQHEIERRKERAEKHGKGRIRDLAEDVCCPACLEQNPEWEYDPELGLAATMSQLHCHHGIYYHE